MKVTIITNYFLPARGGIENHCYNLAKKLLERGLEVHVHTSTDTPIMKNMLKEFEIIDGIKVFRHRSFWGYVPGGDYDIVHLHNYNILPHFFILLRHILKKTIRKFAKIRMEKILITLHGGYTPYYQEFPPCQRILKRLYHKSLGRFFLNYVVNNVIAVSNWEIESLTKEGIRRDVMLHIPNGIDDLAFTLPSLSSNERIRLRGIELKKWKPYVLYLGRISRRKNIALLIKYVSQIAGVNLIVAGYLAEKDYFKELTDIIDNLNVYNKVLFIHDISETEKYILIDNSLAVVLLSYYECEPIAIKEAMARGKPVIVSGHPSLTCLVENVRNGYVATTKEGFKKFLLEGKFSKKMEKSNYGISLKWRWDHIIEQIMKIYRE